MDFAIDFYKYAVYNIKYKNNICKLWICRTFISHSKELLYAHSKCIPVSLI